LFIKKKIRRGQGAPVFVEGGGRLYATAQWHNGQSKTGGFQAYGTLMESHRRLIDQCQFRWPWMTLKGGTRGFKFFRRITLLTLVAFDLERPISAG